MMAPFVGISSSSASFSGSMLVFRGCKESASWLEELVEDPSVSDLVGDSLKGTPSDVQGRGGRGQWALLYQNR